MVNPKPNDWSQHNAPAHSQGHNLVNLDVGVVPRMLFPPKRTLVQHC
jgi:hypothetical protein